MPVNASINSIYSRTVPLTFNENAPFKFLNENKIDKILYENDYHVISENDKFTSNIPPPAEIYTIDVGS